MKIIIWERPNLSHLSYKKGLDDLKIVYSENNALSIIFKNNDILIGVVGEFNNNLKELEKITNTNSSDTIINKEIILIFINFFY